MSTDHPHGRPVTVMKFSDSGEVIVNDEEIEEIFNHEEIQDRKIVVISLIGAFRGGKSYLLNYCLRFLYANYSSINKPKDGSFFFHKNENWMGNKDEPLKGFSWRSGIDCDTIGIIIWSDIFLHTLDNGEKIAIFIMDTQGLFDNNSSPTENSRIFALSSLVSSVQVLNIANRIQEDQLQHLQFASEYTQYTAIDKMQSDEKPFQNLMFLIRDWNNDQEYEFGRIGGMRYLHEEVLDINSQNVELFSVRESITDSFEQFACCLLPHPGKEVASNKNYDGRWSEMDEEFKDELQKLIECLLLPDNLVVKKINSMEINVEEMKEYLQNYLKLFQSNADPEVSSIYDLTIDSYMSRSIRKCIDEYKQVIYENKDLMNDESIETIHENCKKKAMEDYDDMKKMGNYEHVEAFRIKLSEKIDKIYDEMKVQNEKNSSRIEEEMNEQEKKLEKLKQQRKEVEAELDLAVSMLRNLKEIVPENKNELEELNQQMKIAESRIKAAKAEINKLNKKAEKNFKLRTFLISAIGTTAAVGIKVLIKSKPIKACSIM
ncbi:atlastin-like [Chironomus tepperi]|uniref:atlastin-like n=1 Tax=Chironomus tepperi TaxID=113505 RepID=UPI00391FAC3F